MTFTINGNTLKKYEGNEEHVIIPDGVEAIADYAFYGAHQLRGVTFPASLKEIGSDVFYDCEELREADIPDSVYYMGSAVFSRCRRLRKVHFSKKLTSLPKITFYQCDSLQEVILPPRLRRISRACFQQCRQLREIQLPETVKVIEENAFDDCVSLQKITLPDGIEELHPNVFFNCSSLQEINLPASLKQIGKGALETHGKIRIDADESVYLAAGMLENNWNMNWNFGANGRYNGRNEDNYQLHDSWLVNLDLEQWKPLARVILAVNYLESFRRSVPEFDIFILANREEVLEKIISEKRFTALHQALDHQLVTPDILQPYLARIHDPKERALLMQERHTAHEEEEDLLDLL